MKKKKSQVHHVVNQPCCSPIDPIPATVDVLNDTALTLRWSTPGSITQQGLTSYYASVVSECFTGEVKGRPLNFTIPTSSILEITVNRLGTVISCSMSFKIISTQRFNNYTDTKINVFAELS